MIGEEIYNFASELWPINRSITGEGTRKTLKKIKEHLPDLKIHNIPSGTKAFDWIVPKEWNVIEAFIITPSGKKICDFNVNNLHLLGYSIPFKGDITLEELKEHLYTLPDQRDAIPYVTSYYEERWGFCISFNQYELLEDGIYKVVIDSELVEGCLNYGELIIPGKSNKEVFLSTYICHPSMANNELSGPTVLTFLGKWLSKLINLRFTYRIIFIPETIGSIVYLSLNYKEMKDKVFVGFNLSCIGDERTYSYIPSRIGNTYSDQIAKHILKWTDANYKSYTWLDRGSDERQYCSPGIDLPIASILRTKFGEFPEYHTSLDKLGKVVTPNGLNGGYWVVRKSLELIERNKKYKVKALCEPKMSKYNLYPTLSTKERKTEVKLMMNFISYCDGNSSLLEIADKLKIPCWDLYELTKRLEEINLILAKD